MTKPDPELLPIQRPRCSQCITRMKATDVTPEPGGFERRTFQCLKCGHIQTNLIATDPLTSGVTGWLSGELGRSGRSNG